MNLLDKFKNYFLYADKYKTDSKAVIIAIYHNPTNNPNKLEAFNKFYDSIKHLNHRIIEKVTNGALGELETNDSIARLYLADDDLSNEAIINDIVASLPKRFRYVFWLDTDIVFKNHDWLIQGVEELEFNNIIQPFEFCVNLEEGKLEPHFDLKFEKQFTYQAATRHKDLWRSFCANYRTTDFIKSDDIDHVGHTGFAWGARREILDDIQLYEDSTNGNGLIANACASNFEYAQNEAEKEWMDDFDFAVKDKVSFVKGDLYHLFVPEASRPVVDTSIGRFPIEYANLKPVGENVVFSGPNHPTPIQAKLGQQKYVELEIKELGLTLDDFVEKKKNEDTDNQ